MFSIFVQFCSEVLNFIQRDKFFSIYQFWIFSIFVQFHIVVLNFIQHDKRHKTPRDMPALLKIYGEALNGSKIENKTGFLNMISTKM